MVWMDEKGKGELRGHFRWRLHELPFPVALLLSPSPWSFPSHLPCSPIALFPHFSLPSHLTLPRVPLSIPSVSWSDETLHNGATCPLLSHTHEPIPFKLGITIRLVSFFCWSMCSDLHVRFCVNVCPLCWNCGAYIQHLSTVSSPSCRTWVALIILHKIHY